MSATKGPAAARPAHQILLLVFSSTLLLLITFLAPLARADRGQWTPASDIDPNPNPAQRGSATHLALLRGAFGYHSQLLWWGADNKGGVLGWSAGNDDCTLDPLTTLPTIGAWNPGRDLFGGGATGLADGTLLIVGGNESPTSYGIRDALDYSPCTGWGTRASMLQPRWFSSATTLRNGRVLAASGQKYQHLWFFGGRIDGAAPSPVGGIGDSLRRFGPVQPGGRWDETVIPTVEAGSYRPSPVEGYSAAYLADRGAEAYFGGKGNSGAPVVSDVHLLSRTSNALSPDYAYTWTQLVVPGTAPPPRSEHIALAVSPSTMVVYGGLDQNSQPLADAYRLFYNQNTQAWQWAQMTVSGSMSRYGHAAVYDSARQRIIVFGGAGANGLAGSDNLLRTLSSTDGFASGTWHTYSLPSPPKMLNHAMATNGAADLASLAIYLYGGDTGSSSYSDQLWKLTFDPATGNPDWQQVALSGQVPGPRARHSLTYDKVSGRLYLFGGYDAPDHPGDRYVYKLETSTLQSSRWAVAPYNLAGHAGPFDPNSPLLARVAEVYDPQANSWVDGSIASLDEDLHPQHLVVPGVASGTTRDPLPNAGADVVTIFRW